MKIKNKYDHYNRRETSPIFLAKPGKKVYCALSGIDESNVDITVKTNNTSTLTFDIDKYVNGKKNDGYEYLDEQMELYCSGIWFKIMQPPSITNDGLREIKSVVAESYEIMLTQYSLKNFYINMGTEASYEMMYRKNHDSSKFYQVKFYDPKEEKLSLLHLILSHADIPGWKIGYVDNITPDSNGVFLPDAICNFEVENKGVYAFLTQDVSQAYKCIFEFDTVNMLINVYTVDSLGKDTNVVLGFRNIQDDITITRDDSLITQYYVEGLDGYNIEMCNFKSNTIEDLSYFVKEPYMNKAMQDKYTAWIEYKESQRDEFCSLSKEYNSYLTKLTELKYRVPVDSAQNNWFGQKVEDLKTAYNENIAIIKGIEKLYVDKDNNFDLEALKNSHDWPLYESIMNYTLPSIVAAMQAKGEKVDGFGKGNIISCVNPVVMGDDWLYLGADKAVFDTIQLDAAPAWGITRGIKVTGIGGIRKKNITVEKTQSYTLSCYVKGTGSFNLEFGDTGKEREIKNFNISSTWQRVFYTFLPGSKLVDVAFTGSDFTVCGMQLEMGMSPSQFGYFIQSENILKAYETDWKLYGIEELNTKISVYEGCVEELKKNGYSDEYNPLADYDEAYYTQMHQLYLDYIKLIEEATAALKERQAEYDAEKAKQDAIEEKRDTIVKNVSIENFGTVQDQYNGFTPDEIYIIKNLYTQATYTNENIIVTSLDDTVDAVEKQKKLLDDAFEQLYLESHPQYIYENNINNIYALPEFKEYHEELQINNFVRVGITDSLYVKLRLIEISFNPMALNETMNVVFSNMLQYKSRRDDLANLINDSGNGSNRNGGRVTSVNKSNTSDYVITADVIKQIFSNPLFGSIMGGATAGGSGSGGTITADKIVAELVKAKEGVFDKLTADTAFIKYLESKLIVSDKIVTGILQADKAQIEELSATLIKANKIYADVANINKLLAGFAGIGDLTTINLTVDNVTINDAVVKDMIAARISVADLMAHSATAQLITLISSNGNPTIAFKDSTQQFYDSKGNVRVQIGQDGNGDFNFVVRGEDGKTAIMDENGIHREGIPDGTIVNNMIDIGTIGKDKMNFPIVDTDENGNVSITHIYDGNEMFGVKYERFQTEVNGKFNDITNKIKRIDLYSDAQVFINNNDVVTPKTIKVYALTKGDVKIAHWYIDDVEQIDGVAEDKSYIIIPNSLLNENKTSLIVKAVDSTEKIYDIISIYYVYSGVSGFNTATLYLYQRSFIDPALPSERLTYNFITRELTGVLTNGWQKTIPEGDAPLYVTTSTASSQLETAIIESWSNPVVLSKDGEQGLAGLNVSSIYLYQRASTTPLKPTTDITYDFSTKIVSGMNNNWNSTIPSGNDPLYVTIATASANTNIDVIQPSEWSNPVVLSKDGATGPDGYTVFLTNQNDTYICNIDGIIEKPIQNSTQVIVYRGVNQLKPTIGDISPVPGMNITKVENMITFSALKGKDLPEKGTVTIPATIDGKTFELIYSFVKVADTSGALEEMTTTISEVESTVNLVKGELKNKVSETVFNEAQEAINTKYSQVIQDVNGINQTVGRMETDFNEKITANKTSIQQTADKLSLIATGDSETSLTLTDTFIKLVSKNISINADNLTVDAMVNIINTAANDNYGGTKINGGVIDTHTVNAMLIKTGILQSANYNKGVTNDTVFSDAGTKIDMTTGAIESVGFAIDGDGNAYFKGSGEFSGKITASSGFIGGINGFHIESGKLYSGKDSFDNTALGVYVGVDGISLGGRNPLTGVTGKFSVDQYGNMIAKSGTFSGTLEAVDGTFCGTLTSVYINSVRGGTIGGFNITENSLTGSNVVISPSNLKYGNNFIVDSNGKLTATAANITGSITATSGSIGGFSISENGLVSDYVKITPSILTYGNHFKVDSNGKLTASEADLSGKISATSGTIGGFKISNALNDNDHAYAYTLYRQVKNVEESDGNYDYQAGIKAGNTEDKTAATEAAFYVRKKRSSDTWANSTIPFYVRNNGYVYAENMNIGNTLYSTGAQRSESGLESKRYKVMESWVERVAFGMLDSQYNNYATFDKTGVYLWSKGRAVKVVYDATENYITLAPEDDLINTYLGESINPWTHLYVNNIGEQNTPVNSGYFTNLYTKVNGVWTKVTGTSGGGSTTTYTAGDGINISNNEISVALAGEDSGGLKFNNYGNIAISTSFLNSRYSQVNHTHPPTSITWSGLKSSNGDNNGHIHRGVNNSSGYGLWINGSTMIYPASNADGGLNTTTVTDLNSGIDLGGRTVPFRGGYFKKLYLRNTDIESLFYLTVNGSTLYLKNNIDNSIVSNVTLPSGGSVDLSGYATQSWVKSSFGDTLSISGNVLYLKNYNGEQLSRVTLPSGGGSSGSIYSSDITWTGLTSNNSNNNGHLHRGINNSSGNGLWINGSNMVYGASTSEGATSNGVICLGGTNFRFKEVWSLNALNTGSDRNMKHTINPMTSDLEKAYMEFIPVTYMYKNTNNGINHDRLHYGFIAQDIETAINKYNIPNENAGFLCIDYSNELNEYGQCKSYSLRYGEFIAINTHMTQKAHHRIDAQEQEIQELKNSNLQLQGEISILKQQLQELKNLINLKATN